MSDRAPSRGIGVFIRRFTLAGDRTPVRLPCPVSSDGGRNRPGHWESLKFGTVRADDSIVVGGQHSDGSLGRAGHVLLEYLHNETDAMWSLSAAPLGVAFPLVNADGEGLGYLCMVYDGDAGRYEKLGEAVAAALALIHEAEARTPSVPDLTVASTAIGEQNADTRIVAYFQPIVELRTGQVVAVEALARMQTADGVLGPEAFLDSYRTGAAMIGLFDRMLESSLLFLSDHRHRMPDLSAAINLEFAGVPEHGLTELVRARLDEFGTDPESISIELNERIAYELSDAAVEQLRQVTSLGVKLLLDDVPSSFDALERLAGVLVSGAKLDRRYVSQLNAGEREVMAIRTILGRAADAGIELIAEGIETQTQCDKLVRLGCNFGQGYLFAVPQPASSLSAVLDAPLVGSW
jgi:EAL domain-containing protein (putative c-di-GMP-specific phosphodiesterase class I)